MLLRLWRALTPGTPLEGRINRQWGAIGFQGTDPATDLRGMGVLGLRVLVDMAEKQPDSLRGLLREDSKEFYYPLAIAVINIAHDTLQLLSDLPAAANLIFNDESDPVTVFSGLCMRVMLDFDTAHAQFIINFLSRGGNRALCIMQFNPSRTAYFANLRKAARSPSSPALRTLIPTSR